MSVDTLVFLRDDRLPSVKDWQAALDAAQTGIEIDPTVSDLREHSGYLPVTHQHHESGFEWYYGSVREQFDDDPPTELGDRSHVAILVTHDDMRELVSAMLAAAVLAQITDGRTYDEQGENIIDGDAALQEANSIAAELNQQDKT